MGLLEMFQQESDMRFCLRVNSQKLCVIFTQFNKYLLNTSCVLCLVLGAGNLQQSTKQRPSLRGAYILVMKDKHINE